MMYISNKKQLIGSKWKCINKNHRWFDYGEVIEIQDIVEKDGFQFIIIKDSIFRLHVFRLEELFEQIQVQKTNDENRKNFLECAKNIREKGKGFFNSLGNE